MNKQDADFGFVGAAYTAPNPYQDRQICVNWYPETDRNPNAKVVIALLGCPGLIQVASAEGL